MRLGPNFIVRLAAGQNFYLRLTVKKIHAFAVFSNKYLWTYGCSNTNFPATANCANPKTEILCEIIEIQITGIQINLFSFGNGGGIMLFVCEDIPASY